METSDLDELSGGRFIVGLGTQVKRINEERFSVKFEHPAPKLKEYAEVMRTVWAANRGEDVVHEGRFYTVTRPVFGSKRNPPPRDVPDLLRRGRQAHVADLRRGRRRRCWHTRSRPPKYLEEVDAARDRRGGRARRSQTRRVQPHRRLDDLDLGRRRLPRGAR